MFTVGFELEFAFPKKQECPECWGYGSNTCYECDGYGEVECPTCGGHGEVECPSCDGLGEVKCPDCSGAGCTKCDLTGYVACERCDGGYIECETCTGDGRIECPSCEGDGRVGCDRCGGSGYVYDDSHEALRKMERLGADLTYDCSVYHGDCEEGRELRSPVFDYDEHTWEYFIEDITSLIEEGGGESSPELCCGLHIHVRPHEEEGWTYELQEKMYSAWFNWAEEVFLNKFCPDPDRMEEYCQSWEYWTAYLRDEYYSLVQEGQYTPSSRYMTLNTRSLDYHGTLEFRLFNGTLDPGEIKEAFTWVGTLTEAVLLHDDPDEIKEYFEVQLGIVVQAA